MSKLVQWSDDYTVGIEEIDHQHKYLFHLFHQLEQSNNDAKFQSCFIKLYQYTREHFQTEERIMKQHHYPKYAQHQELHHKLISKLDSLSSKIIQDAKNRDELTEFLNVMNDAKNKDELMVFLSDWLLFHILGEDLDIGYYIQAS